MAPMASMLARAASSASAACRASRAAALASARAARSAAAACRVAAAVSRAARSTTDAAATAADLALGTSSREARSLRCDASRGAAPSRLLPLGSDSMVHSDSCLFPDDKPRTPEFVADEKDLESDEALWALYERWCKHFNQERDRDEMARRFDEFKRVVLLVHQENNSDRPYKLAINQFTDGNLSEVCLGGNNDAFHHEELARMAKLPITGSRFIWLDGKYYMEVPEEFQPE